MRSALISFVAILGACSAASPQPPTPAPVVVAVVPTSVQSSAAPVLLPELPAPLAPLPPAVELSGPLACLFDAQRFSGARDIIELSLFPEGKPFLRINGGAARLSVPVGPAGDTLLEIEEGGLVVRGHASASAFLLRPKVPFVLNGFAVPTMFATLTIVEGAEGSMTVNHASPTELDLLGAKLGGARPCADVGLDGGTFDATAARADLDESKKTAVKLIEPGQKVDLRIEPKGKPVARIVLEDATLVQVFESAGGMSRISLPVDTLLVFGWVRSSDLRKAGDMAGGFGTGRGSFGLREPKWDVIERLRCEQEIPLWAEVAGERRSMGLIRPNTAIEVISRTETEARVWVKTRSIHPMKDTEIRARAGDLLGCKRIEEAPTVAP